MQVQHGLDPGRCYKLLEIYEPTLKFHQDEKFYPVSVEEYLYNCRLLKSHSLRPDEDLTTEWISGDKRTPKTLVAAANLLGTKYATGKCYLQYVQPEPFGYWLKQHWLYLHFVLIYITLSWAFKGLQWHWILDAIIILAGLWYVRSVEGFQAVAGGFIAYGMWFLGNDVSLWIQILAIITLIFTILAIWSSRKTIMVWPTDRVIVLGLLAYILLKLGNAATDANLLLLGASVPILPLFYLLAIIPILALVGGLPGFIMDITSRATDDNAQTAKEQIEKVTSAIEGARSKRYTCYGRVVRDERWTALQYHYFYPFNDWRSAANGSNQHEGDWETVVVFLNKSEEVFFDPDNDSPLEPYSVVFSQHHGGRSVSWAEVEKAKNSQDQETCHPTVYVALGSHANYPEGREYPLCEYYQPHGFHGLIIFLDFMLQLPLRAPRFIQEKSVYLIKLVRSRLTHRFNAMTQTVTAHTYLPEYSLPTSLPRMESLTEKPLGNGKVIGQMHIDQCKIRLLTDNSPSWVNFQGLWGDSSISREESGPPGPKWDRVSPKGNLPPQRVSWERPSQWLTKLENPSSRSSWLWLCKLLREF